MSDPAGELLSDADAWRRLDAHLAWAAGPWLAFVLADDVAAVRRLRERALRAVRARGGDTRLIRPDTPQALREVVRELVSGRRPAALTWVEALADDEPWVEAWDDVIVRLNERRERLRRDLGGGLVLAAAGALKARFRERAPDLWSIRSLVLELAPVAPAAGDRRSNAFRAAEVVPRVRFHLAMRRDPWCALVLGDDPAPRRRVLDALGADGLRIVVHAGPSPALSEPGPDLHWLLCDEVWVGLPDALGRASAPVVIEGPASLERDLARGLPELLEGAAFVVHLQVERAVYAGPLPVLEGADEAAREASEALLRARAIETDLPALRGPAEARARTDRVRALSRAVEALLAQGWSTEAAPLAEELVEAASSLRRSDPEALAAEADAHELAGRAAGLSGDRATARQRFLLALPIRRRLARDRGPHRLRRRAELARCLSVLGELALQADEVEAAEAPLREALAIRRRLARLTDDRETLSELATAWSVLGDLELARHEAGDDALDRATDAWREALRLRERVAQQHDAPRFRRLLSVALGRLGQALALQGDWAGARRAWERSRELAHALAELDPGNLAWRVEASVASSRLGDAARAQGDAEAAAAAFREAVEFRQRLVHEDPENTRWHELLAVALGRLGDLALERGDLAEAVKAARRAIGACEHLAWTDPGDLQHRRGLAAAWLRMGDVERARGDEPAAQRSWSRALAAATELAQAGTPAAYRRASEILSGLEARGVEERVLAPLRGRLMGVTRR